MSQTKNRNGQNGHKEDNSPKITQKSKFNQDIIIQENFKLTENQKNIVEAALDKNVRMVIINGVTGSAKTYSAVLSLLKLLQLKAITSIIYIRSLIQSKDGETGYLPGILDDRCYYFNVPLFDQLEQILSKSDIEKIVKDNRIITYPTSMLRGYNMILSGVIADECQNMTFDSLFTIASRIGFKSKLFILGDTTGQNDFGSKSGFQKFCDIFSDSESEQQGVRYFKLEPCDIVRSDFVKFLVEKVNNYKPIINGTKSLSRVGMFE